MSIETVEYLFSPIRPTHAVRDTILREVALLEESKQRNFETTRQNEDLLASLKREELLLNEELLRRFTHISPIRWLPFEVLGAIFKFSVEDNPKALGQLQLVSKSWQCIVKRTPQLWMKIQLVGPFHLDRLDLSKRHIDSCIMNSGKLPLQIVFREGQDLWHSYARPYQNSSVQQATIKLLEYLSLHASERWDRFDVQCNSNETRWQYRARLVYPAIFRAASKLRHLTIHDNLVLQSANDQVKGLSSFLSDHYSNGTTLKTVDLYDIEFHFHDTLSPLNSVQVLSIGFTTEHKWSQLLDGTADRSWLSMFPRLRKLTLNASKTMFIPLYYSHAVNNAAGAMHLYREYEAEHLVELCFHGPAPPWILYNVTFPALKTLIIEANWRSSHVLDEPEQWDGIYLSSIQNLYILCSKCCQFWPTELEDSDLTRYLNQARIHSSLSRFLDVEKVHARSCFWRQIHTVFDTSNDEVGKAAEDTCPELHTVNGEDWRNIFKGLEDSPTQDRYSQDELSDTHVEFISG
jgi:hypothetical protein